MLLAAGIAVAALILIAAGLGVLGRPAPRRRRVRPPVRADDPDSDLEAVDVLVREFRAERWNRRNPWRPPRV